MMDVLVCGLMFLVGIVVVSLYECFTWNTSKKDNEVPYHIQRMDNLERGTNRLLKAHYQECLDRWIDKKDNATNNHFSIWCDRQIAYYSDLVEKYSA